MSEIKIKQRKIDDLIGAKYNPRELTDKQYNDLADSIKRFGLVDPVLVNINKDRKNIIIGGHQRTRVAKDLGFDKVPVVELDLTLEQERELNVRLNKNSGQWDMDMLQEHFNTEELIEWGFEDTDFGDWEEEVTQLEAEEDDFEVPDEVHTDIVLGDLIEIGEHRLLCGDSTSSDDVERLMNGNKADMVFTDPPYGMFLDTDYSNMPSVKKEGNKKYDKIIGDNEDFTPELINTIFANFNDVKEVFIWGADYFAELIPNKNKGSWVVWDKRVEEKFDKMIGSAFELCWSKEKHQRKIARFNNTLFSGEADARNKVHPSQKPLKLAEWFFNNWSNKNDLIADLFLGSGTTMIASHQLGRKCYGMELDPKYCQVIVDRMMKLDPKLKVKINGKEYKKEVNNG